MIALTSAIASIARLLQEWGQPFSLIGGAALIARGRSRLTEDLDVTFMVAKGAEAAFLAMARRHQFSWPQEDEPMFLEAGLVRMASPEGISVDFLTANDALYEAVARRATPIDIGGTLMPVATVEDLLLMKLDANRPIDLDDAIALKDVFGATLDRRYLHAAGEKLGLLKRLESLLGPLAAS